MEMPAGIAASLDRLTAIAGLRATTARGVLDEHGRSEAYHEHRPPDVVVFPTTTQDVVQIVTVCTSLGLPIIPMAQAPPWKAIRPPSKAASASTFRR